MRHRLHQRALRGLLTPVRILPRSTSRDLRRLGRQPLGLGHGGVKGDAPRLQGIHGAGLVRCRLGRGAGGNGRLQLRDGRRMKAPTIAESMADVGHVALPSTFLPDEGADPMVAPKEARAARSF